jgi:hypothetical protein
MRNRIYASAPGLSSERSPFGFKFGKRPFPGHGYINHAASRTLRDVGLKTIDVDYKTLKRKDRYGNQFRYRAKVRDTRDAHLLI